MYDLSYGNEHLAWQQRLVKEEKTHARRSARSEARLVMASNPNSMVNEPYFRLGSEVLPPIAPNVSPPVAKLPKPNSKRSFVPPTVASRTFPSYPRPQETKTNPRPDDWPVVQRKVRGELIGRLERVLAEERKV